MATWIVVILGLAACPAAAAGSNLPLLSGTLRTFQVHACDGQELRLECWPGTVVSISLAQYGRLCPPANHTAAAPCPHALKEMEESCREQRVCRRTGGAAFGGAACPDAEVAYKCRPTVFSNKVVCSGDRLRLRCARNLRIAVLSAAFGATHRGVPECPQPSGEGLLEDCLVSYATEAVMGSCHGRRKCSVAADAGTFGRPPCPAGAALFLKVVHTCVPKEILKELDLGGVAGDDLDEGDYAGFVDEPRYAPPPDHAPHTTDTPKHQAPGPPPASTLKPDMQSDENSGEQQAEEEGAAEAGGGKVVGFLTGWVAALHFIRENKEKFVLYLTLGLSLALVLVLGILVARFYGRRRPVPHKPCGEAGPSGGPFDPPPPDGGFSSLRRSRVLETEEEEGGFPRVNRSNYYYS